MTLPAFEGGLRSFCRTLTLIGLLLSAACGQPVTGHPDRIPLGQVQGRVPGDADGAAHRSPLEGETVVVRGMVHTVLRWQASEGHSLYGLMMQDLPGETDGDPKSSDGIFVYAGAAPNLRMVSQGSHRYAPGDILTLRGTVQERFGVTQLQGARVLEVVPGGDPDELLPPTPLVLSADPAQSAREFARRQSMRVSLRPGAQTVSGSFPNERNRDYLVWVTPAENPILQRANPAARRLFRGAHPLSDLPREHWLDGHGMRLALGSLGLKAREEDDAARLTPMRTGTVFPDLLVGGLHYSFNTHVLQLESAPRFRGGADPRTWRIPSPPGGEQRIRIATYNLENLYDFINDPHSDCDFPGDPGCPGVRQPFNYLPVNDAHYRARLRILARHIVEDLESPHIIMVQEIENQDIGRLTPQGMVYGEENDADGELDALQELAIEIAALGGPVYTTAVNRQAGDQRGIICATLYQADLFEPVEATADHPVLGRNPDLAFEGRPFLMVSEVANPKAFNAMRDDGLDGEPGATSVFSRAVQVFALRERGPRGRVYWLLNNHFSAVPGRRVDRRTAQAEMNAVIATKLMELYPEDFVIVGGDLNVFPRPDDPLRPPSDQLGPLYRAGLENVYDRIVARAPETAYSFVFRGDANTLDHLFLCPASHAVLRHATFVHINADFPEGFRDEPPLRGSDHDALLIELD